MIDYASQTGHNRGQCLVLLTGSNQVPSAIATLDQQYLFIRRVEIRRIRDLNSTKKRIAVVFDRG